MFYLKVGHPAGAFGALILIKEEGSEGMSNVLARCRSDLLFEIRAELLHLSQARVDIGFL